MPQLRKMQPTPRPKVSAASEVVSVKHPKPGEDIYLTWLDLKSANVLSLQKETEHGFRFKVLRRIQEHYSFSFEELAGALSVSTRTLERRKQEGRLDPLESDRALRLARLFSRAAELFHGDEGEAREWLKQKNGALGGVAPVELLNTEFGAREVEQLIGRLQYGVFL